MVHVPTTTIQQPYNNHYPLQHNYNKIHKTQYPQNPQDPKRGGAGPPVPPLFATLRYGAARATGGLPKGPPPPTQDPKGGAGATPRHPAPRRGEGDRRPTQRAAPRDLLSKK